MNVVRHYAHTIEPNYDADVATVEGHGLFLTKLTQ